ncbi:hypothetical protein [Salinimicrobium gaetbulicola]|uniref:Uncharacterized protein n=1 Tax=Salinimicrobium gaetbulicola TaxID=999702 RepID=A0ABW3IEQ9_9FLAO
MIENNQSSNPYQTTSGQVALPFNEEQFKDFIVSLLGKPQTITKRFTGTFDIDKDNLIALYQLLHQRINQQNDSRLIQFRATIYYDDNSTVTLNGFDHLVNYNETLPLVSVSVHLTWQYLLKFRDKDSFEKQEISISFQTSNDGNPVGSMDEFYHPYRNVVGFRISHTARTWGADIEGLLSKHINTITNKDSKFLDFFKYNDDAVENIVSVFLFGITLIFSISKTNQILDVTDTSVLVKHYGNLIFLFFGIYVLTRITIVILERFEIFSSPSFVRLTKETEKHKIKKLKSYKRRWAKYFGTIILSLIIGILSNVLYKFLFVQ